MKSARAISILDAMSDPRLFGGQFLAASWDAWRVFLAALFALPMAADQLATFQKHTGREAAPTRQAREAWLVVGRRGGKSFVIALVAVFLACFRTYRLAPGERGVLMVLAADRKQSRVIFRYTKALLTSVPMLSRLIASERAESLDLTNGITIEVHTANFRSVRGYTVIAALADEIAFWSSDEAGANPDAEIINALFPAMASIPGALLIGISSPYARRGVLWQRYRDHYGKAGDVLVWQADSRAMNPTLPQVEIDRAYRDDPVSAAAEYGAQFRSDVSGFLVPEWIDRAVDDGVSERAPVPGVRYVAFVDPSGGAADSFTLAIAHNENGHAVLDVCRERIPPFEPETVTAEFAAILKRYGAYRVHGDRYAGEWVSAAFMRNGINYAPSLKPKSDLYLESEPMFGQGIIRLLDNLRMLTQFRQLERRTGQGKDRVDHPPRGHDDLANAAAGALTLAKPHADMGTALAEAESANTRIGLDRSVELRVSEMEQNAGRSAPWWDH